MTGWGEPSPLVTPLLVAIIFGSIALQYVPTLDVARLQATFPGSTLRYRSGCSAFALLAITTFGPAGVAPFIYYRF